MYTSCPNPRTKESGSLYSTTVLEIKSQVLAVYVAFGMSLILDPLSQQCKEMYL